MNNQNEIKKFQLNDEEISKKYNYDQDIIKRNSNNNLNANYGTMFYENNLNYENLEKNKLPDKIRIENLTSSTREIVFIQDSNINSSSSNTNKSIPNGDKNLGNEFYNNTNSNFEQTSYVKDKYHKKQKTSASHKYSKNQSNFYDINKLAYQDEVYYFRTLFG